jgi:hypothetical protein
VPAAEAVTTCRGPFFAALLLRLVRGARQVAGALTVAISKGLAVAAALQFLLGQLNGSCLAKNDAIGLALAVPSRSIIWLESPLGNADFGLGAVTMMLIGNPLSGTSAAPELLPPEAGDQ